MEKHGGSDHNLWGSPIWPGAALPDAAHPQPAPRLTRGAGYEYRAVSDPENLHVLREPFGLQEDRPGGIDDLRMKTGSLATALCQYMVCADRCAGRGRFRRPRAAAA